MNRSRDQDHRNAIEALKIINEFNYAKNDTEAYLYLVARWGMGLELKPSPKDFVIEIGGIDESL